MTDYIIYKYDLDAYVVDNVIPMPEGAIILHVAAVNDQLAMWARVDPNARVVERHLSVIENGTPVALGTAWGQHVGSGVLLGGQLVAHVFDLGQVIP